MEHFIFDWSGTLIDNQRAMYRAVKRIFAIRRKSISWKTFEKEFRQPLPEFYALHLPEVPYEVIKKELLKFYIKEKSQKLFPGVRETVCMLKQQGKRIYVFSSHPEPLLKKEMKQNRIAKFVDEAWADVRDKKTSLQALAKEKSLPRRKTCYVGDMTDDIRAAHRAGIQSVAVSWGYHSLSQLRKEKPHRVLKSIKSLSRL
ncbi:MAG: HAD family hydrolase [Candidatus Sungbacteria bacterium]|nr:HAD family hydrolase [Candidatus Sungbacteria bacterium]